MAVLGGGPMAILGGGRFLMSEVPHASSVLRRGTGYKPFWGHSPPEAGLSHANRPHRLRVVALAGLEGGGAGDRDAVAAHLGGACARPHRRHHRPRPLPLDLGGLGTSQVMRSGDTAREEPPCLEAGDITAPVLYL
jgi:hypothetical protein